jgi:hypothetical protein
MMPRNGSSRIGHKATFDNVRGIDSTTGKRCYRPNANGRISILADLCVSAVCSAVRFSPWLIATK